MEEREPVVLVIPELAPTPARDFPILIKNFFLLQITRSRGADFQFGKRRTFTGELIFESAVTANASHCFD